MRYAQMFPELPNICGQGLSGAGEGCWFYASRPNTQEPIQKTQQYTTAKQRLVKEYNSYSLRVPVHTAVHQDTTGRFVSIEFKLCMATYAGWDVSSKARFSPLKESLSSEACQSQTKSVDLAQDRITSPQSRQNNLKDLENKRNH